jgi:hypothetical protein
MRPILFACVTLILTALPQCPSLSGVMDLYGYMPLTPPSTLLQPGSMLYADKDGGVFGVACGPRASLGAGWVPKRSATWGSETRKLRNKEFKLSGDMMEQFKADAKFEAVRDITVSIDDAQLLELDDTDVLENIRYRSEACRAAVEGRIANGFRVTMVRSGMIASLVYKVEWKQQAMLDAKSKIEVVSGLAASLGGGVTCLDEQTFRAKGLMIGIRNDAYLASVSAPNVVPEHQEGDIDAEGVAKQPRIDQTPDAPIVPTVHQNFPPKRR